MLTVLNPIEAEPSQLFYAATSLGLLREAVVVVIVVCHSDCHLFIYLDFVVQTKDSEDKKIFLKFEAEFGMHADFQPE